MNNTLRHALEPEVGKAYVTMDGSFVFIIEKSVNQYGILYLGHIPQGSEYLWSPDGSCQDGSDDFDLFREATPEELQQTKDSE